MTRFAEDIPGSFRVVSILAVIWMVLGCLSYLMHVTMAPADIAQLPPGQAELMRTTPPVVYALFGIATWGGLIGAVLMLMKRRLAVPVLLASWIAALLQFGYVFTMLNGIKLLGWGGTVFPIVIVGLGIFFWNYAKGAEQKGWLR